MSIVAAKSFLMRIRTDEAFYEAIMKCNDAAEIINFVTKSGYDFTTEEIESVSLGLCDEE